MTKIVATLIYVGVGTGMWWFFQSRARILGDTEEARRVTHRNTVLVVGVFGILIIQTWAATSSRAYIGGVGIGIVLVTYTVMLVLSIRRRRSGYREIKTGDQ